MKFLIILSLSILISGAPPPAPYADHCIVGEKTQYDPKTALATWFTIDLDAPPAERWNEVAQKYSAQIKELIGVIKSLTVPFFHGKLIQFVDKYMGKWDERLPQPYREEIMGLANATGVPLGEMVLYNIFYELNAVCTSIVASNPSGKLFHSRNMDFGLFMGWNPKTHQWSLTEKLRPLIINVKWKKNGTELYKSVNFAGFIGVYNGVRKGEFSLTANERFNIQGGYVGVIRWLLKIGNSKWMTWLAREVMEEATSYDHAYKMLSETSVMSPVYFILGGSKNNEGAIIARALDEVVGTVHLNTSADNGWYILQTNYDPGKEVLFLDDRRTPGNACMQKLGRKQVGFEGIYNVLSSKTTLNKLTAYTVLMEVEGGKLETYIRTCPDPCWAW